MTDEIVEITKAQEKQYKDALQLLEGIWADKDDGLAFKRMIKKKNPNARIPELDIAEPMLEPVKAELAAAEKRHAALLERIDAKEKAEREAKEEGDLRAQLAAAQKEYRLTDEGMDLVKKRMKETGNPDPSAAAAWITDHAPKSGPVAGSSFSPSEMNLFGSREKDDAWADLHKDPVRWADKEAASMIDAWNRGEEVA